MMEVGKKNIEWAKLSVSPITGCNGPGGVRCEFCYAHRIAQRFKNVHDYPKPDPFIPAFHPKRLDQIIARKKPTIWFMFSMADWLDDGVKPEWRGRCLEVMGEAEQHVFVTLTKQYKNLWKVAYDSPSGMIPRNVWVGISVCYRDQVWGMEELRKVDSSVKLVSFEPLKEDVSNIVHLDDIDWIIIGAQSKQAGIGDLPSIPYFRPEKTWVQKLVYKACQRPDTIPTSVPWTKVFLKPNLGDYVADGWFSEKVQEMPDPHDYAPEGRT